MPSMETNIPEGMDPRIQKVLANNIDHIKAGDRSRAEKLAGILPSDNTGEPTVSAPTRKKSGVEDRVRGDYKDFKSAAANDHS